MKYLLKNGANGNIESLNGDTLLMHAAANGKNDMIKQLLSNGVDINTKVN